MNSLLSQRVCGCRSYQSPQMDYSRFRAAGRVCTKQDLLQAGPFLFTIIITVLLLFVLSNKCDVYLFAVEFLRSFPNCLMIYNERITTKLIGVVQRYPLDQQKFYQKRSGL